MISGHFATAVEAPDYSRLTPVHISGNDEIKAKNIPYKDRLVRVTELRDISESKQAEQDKVNAQKIAGEQKQLAMVGQVAGKIAHDFNNLLGVVMGNSELALLNVTDEDIRQRLNLIFEQTKRGKNLTRNLVAFTRSQDPKQDFFKIKDKIDMVITLPACSGYRC